VPVASGPLKLVLSWWWRIRCSCIDEEGTGTSWVAREGSS
jgi:hypothetical protein